MRFPTFAVFFLLSLPCLAKDTEVYFSPKGGCETAIIRSIDAAEMNIHMAAYSFTSEPISKALLRAVKRGVRVFLLVDKRQLNAQKGKTKLVSQNGVATSVDQKHYLMHQKLIVVDNHTVLCGSYNFSDNARDRNSEILLVLEDEDVAEECIKHFTKLFRAGRMVSLFEPVCKEGNCCGASTVYRGPPAAEKEVLLWQESQDPSCRSTRQEQSQIPSRLRNGKAGTTSGRGLFRRIRKRRLRRACAR